MTPVKVRIKLDRDEYTNCLFVHSCFDFNSLMTTAALSSLASNLSPAKALNVAKVLSSYYYSRARNTPEQWGLPVAIAIEPTTSCNLRCPECPSGLRSFSRPT